KQNDIAKYLGVTRGTYSHYENARLMPPTDALYKLSAYYKVSLAKLISLAVQSPRNENTDIRASEYIVSDDDVTVQLDELYNGFLSECADMSPKELGDWTTIEDREIIYYYHKLSGKDKRLFTYFLKLALLSSFDSKKDNS
ncbi:MAG: helix-turn-helix transcriptional regulator, partial [Butyrivibrio sp.]|nr:helix-turn-helix transcriptional regulator [Butyrivibrio sp.]